MVVGVDVFEPFELEAGACLDLSPGFDRDGRKIWFVRYYSVDDTFKHPVTGGAILRNATFGLAARCWCGRFRNLERRMRRSWTHALERPDLPGETEHESYRRWQWMLDIDHATAEQKNNFLSADRYSSAEIAVRVDQDAWHARRAAIRASYSTSLARPSLDRRSRSKR